MRVFKQIIEQGRGIESLEKTEGEYRICPISNTFAECIMRI